MVGCGVVLIAAVATGAQSLLDSATVAAQRDRPASPATATHEEASSLSAVPSTAQPTGFQLYPLGAATTPGVAEAAQPQAQLTAAVLLDIPARQMGTPGHHPAGIGDHPAGKHHPGTCAHPAGKHLDKDPDRTGVPSTPSASSAPGALDLASCNCSGYRKRSETWNSTRVAGERVMATAAPAPGVGAHGHCSDNATGAGHTAQAYAHRNDWR